MKKNKKSENYLERVPVRPQWLNWTSSENSVVTLDIENKGVFNRIAQLILKKPKVSHIHLDEVGSFIWTITDGEKNIAELALIAQKEFGEKINPLYERIAQYFKILDSYGFIEWK
jgi:hypothetical protein